MVTKTEIDQRVKERMDLVEKMIQSNQHISEPEEFAKVLGDAGKYWTAMSEGDKEYYEYSAWAFNNKKPWKA